MVWGCAGPAPDSPPSTMEPPPVDRVGDVTQGSDAMIGSEDSVSVVPGSPDALYRFRFKQIEPPAERFNFQDRDLSFYWKPAPSALHFQVENRQGRPVYIEWDRSTFYSPPSLRSGKVAHASTRWDDRFRVQTPTQIGGLQRYGDYLLPVDYLLDPAGSTEQLHRPLFPEDATALQYENSEFGVDLVFRIDERFRTYSFRFRVASILPR
jgi:hypothetical protein